MQQLHHQQGSLSVGCLAPMDVLHAHMLPLHYLLIIWLNLANSAIICKGKRRQCCQKNLGGHKLPSCQKRGKVSWVKWMLLGWWYILKKFDMWFWWCQLIYWCWQSSCCCFCWSGGTMDVLIARDLANHVCNFLTKFVCIERCICPCLCSLAQLVQSWC